MKRPCRNASQTSIIKMRELHPIPLKTFNFNWMKKIKKQLLYLAIAEFAALLTFVYVWWVFSTFLNTRTVSLMTFSYLIFILLQGSIYWLYRYIFIIKKRNFGATAVGLFTFLSYLNIIVLVCVGILIPVFKSSTLDLIIGIAAFLFGVIEYINYYWYRLSYGKSGFNIKRLTDTKLKKSSIRKMIIVAPLS